jgi:hypothetical protein
MSSMGAGWQIRVDGNTLQALSNPERHRAPNNQYVSNGFSNDRGGMQSR